MDNNSIISSLVNQISSFVNEKEAFYLSIPITSGKRFILWYAQDGKRLFSDPDKYNEAHLKNVIKPNIHAAKEKIKVIRDRLDGTVIDPTSFEWPEWRQEMYHMYWTQVIEKYVKTVIFFDGWQYSNGCSLEYLTALDNSLEILDERLIPLRLNKAIELLHESALTYSNLGLHRSLVCEVYDQLLTKVNERKLIKKISSQNHETSVNNQNLFKDDVLNNLASVANVAQFISYAPGEHPVQRYAHLFGYEKNVKFNSLSKAISSLLETSPEGTVNIRSFLPDSPKGHPLIYGLKDVDTIIKHLYKNASEGKFSIVNETVDVNDGGVSGVTIGDVIEFIPGDTPKGVDKPGVCSMPRNKGINLLETVYGFKPKLDFDPSIRVEFSLHPKKRGLLNDYTIIWELEDVGEIDLQSPPSWPNKFSQHIGDKAFGLLIAHLYGLPVPKTTVISRKVAPFTFGKETGLLETWTRTCPVIRTPGKYSTFFGWYDPFKLLNEEDSSNGKDFKIASVLSQKSVYPVYSGSLMPGKNKSEPYIEGVRGRGDDFMLGSDRPVDISPDVIQSVKTLYQNASLFLGNLEIEWVYDGYKTWVVQLHKTELEVYGNIVFPGTPKEFLSFDVSNGLEALREVVNKIQGSGQGIKLIGDVGITSHFGDILRSAKIPSYIEK